MDVDAVAEWFMKMQEHMYMYTEGQTALVESRGLSRDSTCVLKANPGKLDIKRREPGILFISIYQFTHC